MLVFALSRHDRSELLPRAGAGFAAVAVLYAPVVVSVLASGYLGRDTQGVRLSQHGFFAPSLDGLIPRTLSICNELGTTLSPAALSAWRTLKNLRAY